MFLIIYLTCWHTCYLVLSLSVTFVVTQPSQYYVPSQYLHITVTHSQYLHITVTHPSRYLHVAHAGVAKVLMCGWRRDIRDMVMLLDSLLLSGSELHLLSEVTVKDRYKEVRV